MTEIWTMGELLAELMRPQSDVPLGSVGPFTGPFPSGAPGIFIDTVARLGRSGGIVSGVGDDEFGQAILERLRKDGVKTDHVRVVADRSTGVAFISYGDDAGRSYVFHWDGTPAVMAEAPPAEIAEGVRFFHVMGCSLMANADFAGRIATTATMFADARAQISFDPNIRGELLADRAISGILEPILSRCSILLSSDSELEMLAGVSDPDEAVAELKRRYPLEIVVVKHGPRGCAVYGEGERIDVPAFVVDEIDPTGAGDCFDAGFLCGLLEGLDLRDAARLGSAAGALNAAALGPMEGRIDRASVARLMEA